MATIAAAADGMSAASGSAICISTDRWQDGVGCAGPLPLSCWLCSSERAAAVTLVHLTAEDKAGLDLERRLQSFKIIQAKRSYQDVICKAGKAR